MILIALDFWSIIVYCFLASVVLVGYRLTWRLAYASESFVVSLARTGLHGLARGLLQLAIGYNEQTYQRSRFIIWNQVHVRFFMLWGSLFVLAATVWLFRIPTIVWLPVMLSLAIYRLVTLWLNPPRPPIHTQDPALKKLIQDVNEPFRSTRRSARPLIRHWDYLDELFAEPV